MTRPRLGVCDYGVGNLRSVERAIAHGGGTAVISGDPAVLDGCDALVLPGVGAFAVAAAALHQRCLDVVVRHVAEQGKPVLGVCLGFQLLFSDSDEGPGGAGLGLIPGTVRRIGAGAVKVPHMGWNRLDLRRESRLLDGVGDGEHMYFVHSYAAQPDDEADVVAVTDHGGSIVAAVERGTVSGTQFHPEKSGAAGLAVYANLVSRCAAPVRA